MTRGRPHTNSSRNPLPWGGKTYWPPTLGFLPPFSPFPAQPGRGDPTGHSSDTAKRRGDMGWGVWPRWTRAPPPSNLCGQRPPGRYQTGQTNEQTGKGRGRARARGTPVAPAPTPQPLLPPTPPSTRTGSQPQVGAGGVIRDPGEERGEVWAVHSDPQLPRTAHTSGQPAGTARPAEPPWLRAPTGSASREGTSQKTPPNTPRQPGDGPAGGGAALSAGGAVGSPPRGGLSPSAGPGSPP